MLSLLDKLNVTQHVHDHIEIFFSDIATFAKKDYIYRFYSFA